MTAKEIASICNNDGQGVEFIVRKFFDESYGKYIQAKRTFSFDRSKKKDKAIQDVQREMVGEESRKYLQFLSFCRWMVKNTNDGTLVMRGEKPYTIDEHGLAIMFAIGCEMIERKVDIMTLENDISSNDSILNWIFTHCGMTVFDWLFSKKARCPNERRRHQ